MPGQLEVDGPELLRELVDDGETINESVEQPVKHEKLVIVAAIAYPNAHTDEGEGIRFAATQDLARNAAAAGVEIVFINNTPLGLANNYVTNTLEELGAQVWRPSRGGLHPQQAIGAMYAVTKLGATRVLVTEPEKPDIVNHLDAIMEVSKDVDITLVGYDEQGLATLPPIQREFEGIMGERYQQELDLPIRDVWRGPRVYSAAAVEVLADYENEPGVQWGHLVGVALQAREREEDPLTVGGVELSMEHPPAITAYETGREEMDRKRAFAQFLPQMRALREKFSGMMRKNQVNPETTEAVN